MSIDNERVIELSRTKLVALTAGSLVLAAAGAWLIVAGDGGALAGTLRRFAPVWMVRGLGVVTVLTFGGFGVLLVIKALDRKPGLVLGREGFVDNSSAVAAGFIPWSEVANVGLLELNGQRMLIVHVADPEKYAARGNPLKRALNRANTSMCGSPVVISANALRVSLPELHREFTSRLAAHGGAAGRDERTR